VRSRKTGAEGNRSQIVGGMTNDESGDAHLFTRNLAAMCASDLLYVHPHHAGARGRRRSKYVQLANAGVVRVT
jgi:hypothetical protein